jgi:hypothetical protein
MRIHMYTRTELIRTGWSIDTRKPVDARFFGTRRGTRLFNLFPQWRSTSNMRLKSAQSVSSSPLLKAFARRGHRIARSILHLRNVSLGGPSHSFASRRMQNRLRYLVHCRTEKWRLREPPIFSFSILVS